jgi:hypothetical protein
MAIGLRPGVNMLEGATCEFVLGALLAFTVLWSSQFKSGCVPLLLRVRRRRVYSL